LNSTDDGLPKVGLKTLISDYQLLTGLTFIKTFLKLLILTLNFAEPLMQNHNNRARVRSISEILTKILHILVIVIALDEIYLLLLPVFITATTQHSNEYSDAINLIDCILLMNKNLCIILMIANFALMFGRWATERLLEEVHYQLMDNIFIAIEFIHRIIWFVERTCWVLNVFLRITRMLNKYFLKFF
jgi:hypothetical protein